MAAFQSDDTRWAALVARNALSDGAFVYSVKQTGIFCRPTCTAARLARRSHVVFHDTPASAKAAGFRACEQCKPEMVSYDPQKEAVAKACQSIQQAENHTGTGVKLEELAEEAGLTKYNFHRAFKKITGVTPKVYASNIKAEKSGLSGASQPNAPSSGLSAACSATSNDGAPTARGYVNTALAPGFAYDATESQKTAQKRVQEKIISALDGMANFSKREVEYTIQPWFNAYVLIAITKAGICSLDTGDTPEELFEALSLRFPVANLQSSPWSPDREVMQNEPSKYSIFTKVMEALVNPTGKTLNVPFDMT